MKLFLAALTLWSLPFFGISCGPTSVQNQEPELALTPPVAATATLTKEHPTASFAIYPDLNDPPTRVEIAVKKVVNPAAQSVNIFVYLTPMTEKPESSQDKISLGTFSLYPADRPGKFMLDPVPAFRKASQIKGASNIKEWLVTLELKQETEQGTSPLEVTIEQPQWKRDKN